MNYYFIVVLIFDLHFPNDYLQHLFMCLLIIFMSLEIVRIQDIADFFFYETSCLVIKLQFVSFLLLTFTFDVISKTLPK